jgi:hypothetical protein
LRISKKSSTFARFLLHFERKSKQNNNVYFNKTKKIMKKISTLFMGILVALSAVAAPQFTVGKQDLSAMKAGMETKKIDVESFAALKAPKATKAHVVRLLANEAVSGITFAECAYYPSYEIWELDVFNADTNLVSSFMFKNGETQKIAGNYVADENKNAAVQHVAAVGDTVALQGAFAIAYDSEGEKSAKYHVTATGLVDAKSRSFDFDFIVEVAAFNYEAYYNYYMAYQYALYYYQQYMTTQSEDDYNAFMYYYQLMQQYGSEVDIDLLDAPVIITGDTLSYTINDLKMNDQQATYGWWQISGYNEDSTLYVTLSNLTDSTRATAVGTYTYAEMDYKYSFLNADGETVHFADSGSVVVSMNENGSYQVAASLLGRDGNVYELTLNSFPLSANKITIAYANDTLKFSVTNDDPYFLYIETKDEYDYYQSDFSQASVNDEVDSWLDYLESASDYVANGNIYLLVSDFFGEELEAGEYVALAAPIYNNSVRNGDASYLLFEVVLPEGVENVEAKAVKAVKFLRNGQLIIRKNGAEYNAFGTLVK